MILKAETYRKRLDNQVEREEELALEKIPELLEELIDFCTDDGLNYAVIPSPHRLESNYDIARFYANYYFILHHIDIKDLKEQCSYGSVDYKYLEEIENKAKDYYYFQYLFYGEKVSSTAINLLKENGFEVGYDEEINPENEEDVISIFNIYWGPEIEAETKEVKDEV